MIERLISHWVLGTVRTVVHSFGLPSLSEFRQCILSRKFFIHFKAKVPTLVERPYSAVSPVVTDGLGEKETEVEQYVNFAILTL